MVAIVRDGDGHPVGLHRIYLERGGASKAKVDGSTKMMLGPVAGGCIRLADLGGK